MYPVTGLKALFLEGNGIDSLDGLPPLPELKCLFIQQNCISELTNLESVPELATLDVSNNRIKVRVRPPHDGIYVAPPRSSVLPYPVLSIHPMVP